MMTTARADAKTRPFQLYWHRQGNRPAGLNAVLQLTQAAPTRLAGRPVVHGVELDLKWAGEGDRLLLYAWHGPTGGERLSAAQVRRRSAAGRLLTLEELLRQSADTDLGYLVELKTGHGPPRPALVQLARLLTRYGAMERTRLVTSSLPLLDDAAELLPRVPRGLFIMGLWRRWVLHLPTVARWRGFRRGLLLRADCLGLHFLSKVGVLPRLAPHHLRLASGAGRARLEYLPGRVTGSTTLQELAAAGAPGAFAYGPPAAFVSGCWPA